VTIIPKTALEHEVGSSDATCLILRNLPAQLHQQGLQDWLVEQGYAGLYDFLLWFPATRTSRLKTSSYAFINFSEAKHMHRFCKQALLLRFPTAANGDSTEADERAKSQVLSADIAKVQGFEENYVRFHHLLDPSSQTLCSPYFDPEKMNDLSRESVQRAMDEGIEVNKPKHSVDNAATTLIIRNLPVSVAHSQEAARAAFDKRMGRGNTYNFFVCFPAKSRKTRAPEMYAGGVKHGLPYAFVNFNTPADAQRCTDELNGWSPTKDAVPLSVITASNFQGKAACVEHFSKLSEHGGIVPFIGEDSASTDDNAESTACTNQFQYQ